MKARPRFTLWPRTLRAQFALLLVVFWALPLTALSAYTVLIYRNNVASDLRTTMDSRIYYAALLTNENLVQAVTTSRQITYDSTLEDLSDRYQESILALDTEDETYTQQVKSFQNDLKASCLNYLDNQFGLDDDISMAVLFLDVRPEYSIYRDFTGDNLFDYFVTFVARRARNLSGSLGNRVVFLAYNDHLYILRSLRRTDNSSALGWMVLELNTSSTCSFLLDAVPGNEPVYLQLGNYTLSLRTEDFSSGSTPTITPAMAGIQENLSYITFTGWFKNRDFSMGYQVPLSINYLDGFFNRYNQLLMITGAVAIVLILLMIFLFRQHITKPLESLSNAAWALQHDDLGVHAESHYNDELGDLITSFNAMSDRIKELFDHVYKEQLAVKDARIMALQSQINPHFFNNTLELMNWKARMLGDEQLSSMIQALSTMLDSAMDRSNTRYVRIKSELDVSNAYLTIIQARFGHRLSIEYQIDNSLLEYTIPRMVLQPLIENAIVHGLEPSGGGKLILNISREDHWVNISVINDGKPLSPADFSHIELLLTQPVDHNDPRSQRLGIRNVNERLVLLYGDEAALHFESDSLGRTVCRFRIPTNLQTP